jgi:hypothetical protein
MILKLKEIGNLETKRGYWYKQKEFKIFNWLKMALKVVGEVDLIPASILSRLRHGEKFLNERRHYSVGIFLL